MNPVGQQDIVEFDTWKKRKFHKILFFVRHSTIKDQILPLKFNLSHYFQNYKVIERTLRLIGNIK